MNRRDKWDDGPVPHRESWRRASGASRRGAPCRHGGPPSLRLLRLSYRCGRSTTVLEAGLQRWRTPVQQKQWMVELAWVEGLRKEDGERSRLTFVPWRTLVRLDLDASLSPAAATLELNRALAELLAKELSEASR